MPFLKTQLETTIFLHVSNVNDETRHNFPDEVSELSAPNTHFDRQTHTHHNKINWDEGKDRYTKF